MLQSWTAGRNGVTAFAIWSPFAGRTAWSRCWSPCRKGRCSLDVHRNVEAEFSRTIGGLSSELAVKWIDARSWFNDENWFYDSHHLTPDSAQGIHDSIWKGIRLARVQRRHRAGRHMLAQRVSE